MRDEILLMLLRTYGAAVFFAFVYILSRMRQISVKRKEVVLTVCAMITAFLAEQLVLTKGMFCGRIVWCLCAAAMLLLTVFAADEYIRIRRRINSEITLMCIKECFDGLATGLCFYSSDGMPQLVNPVMDSICISLTGSRLYDALLFREAVESRSINGKGQPIVQLDDGRTYSFVCYEEDAVCELVASDITEEFRLTEELEESRKRSTEINTRLKALNSTIRYVIMEKEVLRMKVRIHDELGQALLMAKKYIKDSGSVDSTKLLELWQNSVLLLSSERSEKWQKPYFVNLQRAALLGIEVLTDGMLPEDEALIPVIDTAIAVHTTNVLRHAEGSQVRISVNTSEEGYELIFTNNGRPPVRGVRETGGLANLRRQTEAAGGGMKIRALPEFQLILRLPKNKKDREA